MDGSVECLNSTESTNISYDHVLEHLLKAKEMLSPIVEDVIFSTFDQSNFSNYLTITNDQYQKVLQASDIFREAEYDYVAKNRPYTLPNSEVIVNNVRIEHRVNNNGAMIINENTLVELLQLYENMGAVIERLTNTMTKDTRNQSTQKCTCKGSSSGKSGARSTAYSKTSETTSTNKTRGGITTTDTEEEKRDDEDCDDPQILIKIECCSNMFDNKNDNKMAIDETKSTNNNNYNNRNNVNDNNKNQNVRCPNHCGPPCEIEYDGKAVPFDHKNLEDGQIININGGEFCDDDIRIIIKQCEECSNKYCRSGTTTKIEELVFGESHESVTLHGNHADETKMEFSSDDDNKVSECCQCDANDSPAIHVTISAPYCDQTTSCCSCKKRVSVLIDTKSLEKSTVNVDKSKLADNERRLPLTRKRVCSSMQFDVANEDTKLRNHEIDHKNSYIRIQLQKMGVDKILRACRPAKCCRKSILNERQRTGLPYCVSLRSLPLVDKDVEVIKQSFDMSMQNTKNSVNLSKADKDKLAYYVSLGREDFKPNSSFPWVIPVYDVKSQPRTDRLFVLKKIDSVPDNKKPKPKKSKIPIRIPPEKEKVSKACTCITKENKYYLLTNPEKEQVKPKNRFTVTKTTKLYKKELAEKEVQARYDSKADAYAKVQNDKRGLWKRKNIWTDSTYGDYHLLFDEEHKQMGANGVGFQVDKNKKCYYEWPYPKRTKKSQEPVSSSRKKNYKSNVTLKGTSRKSSIKSDDFSCLSSKQKNENFTESKPTSPLESDLTSVVLSPPKSTQGSETTSTFWKQEEVFFASKAFTCFMRHSSSLEKTKNNVIKKEECEEDCTITPNKCESTSENNKLHYYVNLVDGNLLWSNTAPAEPQSYQAFYNYDNENVTSTKEEKPSEPEPSTSEPVEETVEAIYVPPEQSRQFSLLAMSRTSQIAEDPNAKKPSRTSVISELKIEDMQPITSNLSQKPASEIKPPSVMSNQSQKPENKLASEIKPPSVMSNQSQKPETKPLSEIKPSGKMPLKVSGVKPLPQEFDKYSLGPETELEEWAPLVVSDVSLPDIHEEQIEVKKVQPVEAVPVKESKVKIEPEPKPQPEPEPESPKEPPRKRKCVEKQICTKNQCTECDYQCDKKKERRDKLKPKRKCSIKEMCKIASKEVINLCDFLKGAKNNKKDIKIEIKTTKDNGLCIKGKAPPPCTKEVCEIYKNKNMGTSKKGQQCVKIKRKESDQKFLITSSDSIEIYINNQKIRLSNKTKSKEDDKNNGKNNKRDKKNDSHQEYK